VLRDARLDVEAMLDRLDKGVVVPPLPVFPRCNPAAVVPGTLDRPTGSGLLGTLRERTISETLRLSDIIGIINNYLDFLTIIINYFK